MTLKPRGAYIILASFMLLGCQRVTTARELGLNWLPDQEKMSLHVNEERGFQFYTLQKIDGFGYSNNPVVVQKGDDEYIIQAESVDTKFFSTGHWNFFFGEVHNEDEINAWISKKFLNTGCKIQNMEDANADGVFEISVEWAEDPEQMGAFKCTGPLGSQTLYNPQKNTIVHFVTKPNEADGKSTVDGSNASLIPYGLEWQ